MPIPDVIPAGTPNIRLHPNTVHSWKPQRFAIVCIDRNTGKLRWSRVVHEAMPHQGHHRKAGFASASPVTDGQHIYASFGSFGLYCYVPSPMLWGEEIYLLEDEGFFSCLRAKTGERHYLEHRLPGVLNFSASPVGAADRIYLLSEIGKTVVLQRGPVMKVLAINELDETFHASPAIVGNAIFLRGHKHLFCFAKASR